jgi:Methyltransferase domain
MAWTDIPGWCDFTDIYADAVTSASQGGILVEVGVAFGRSLAFLASECIRQGRRDVRILAVDPWVDDWTQPHGWTQTDRPSWGGEHAEWARAKGGPFSAFTEMMRTHAPEELERTTVLRCMGWQAAFVAATMQGSIDFVFIDGDHRYEGVKKDIDAWYPIVRSGGVIAGHDYTHEFPGVLQAVKECFPRGVETKGTSWIVRKQ